MNDAPVDNSFFRWVRGLGVQRSENRWIGGVSAGIGQRFGIDPILARGLMVVLALLSGVGLLLYGLAWALLPEPDGRIHLQEAGRGRWTAGMTGALVFFLLGVVDRPGPFGWYDGAWDGWWNGAFWLLVVGGFIWWLATRDANKGRRGTADQGYDGGPGTPGAPGAFGRTPGTPRHGGEPPMGGAAPFAAPPAPGGGTAPAGTESAGTAWAGTESAGQRRDQDADATVPLSGIWTPTQPIGPEPRQTSSGGDGPGDDPAPRQTTGYGNHGPGVPGVPGSSGGPGPGVPGGYGSYGGYGTTPAKPARLSRALPGHIVAVVLGVAAIVGGTTYLLSLRDIIDVGGRNLAVSLAAALVVLGAGLVGAAAQRRTGGALTGFAIALLIPTLLVGAGTVNRGFQDARFGVVTDEGPNSYGYIFASGEVDLTHFGQDIAADTTVDVDTVFASVDVAVPDNIPVVVSADGAFYSLNVMDGGTTTSYSGLGDRPDIHLNRGATGPVLTLRLEGAFNNVEVTTQEVEVTP